VDGGRLGLDSLAFDNKLVSPSIWNAEGRDQSSLKIWTVKTVTRFASRLYTCASTICSSASRRTRTCTEPAWMSNTCSACKTEQVILNNHNHNRRWPHTYKNIGCYKVSKSQKSYASMHKKVGNGVSCSGSK